MALFFKLLLLIILSQQKDFTVIATYTNSVSTAAHIFTIYPLSPSCSEGVINSFSYVAEGADQIKISYTCTANSAIGENNVAKTTPPNLSYSVNMHVLDRHVVDCGSGYAISSFAVANDGCSVWYSFQCRTVTEENCNTLTSSGFRANKLPWMGFYLSYFLSCSMIGAVEENTALTNFWLSTMSDSGGSATYYYSYTKCTIRFCDVACNNCYSSYNPSDCIACATNKGYYPIIDNMKRCVNTAPIGYYLNNSVYVHCLPQCYTCSGGGIGDNHQCTKCESSNYPLQDLQTSCYSTVQYGYFKSTSGLQWDNCYPSCGSCNSLGAEDDHLCTECRTKYLPLADKHSSCYLTVPYGYFKNTNGLQWDNCYYSCAYCTGLGIEEDHLCTECRTGYWPLADRRSKCYSTVQYGYFKSTNGLQWDNCYYSCAYCTGLGTEDDHLCTECRTGYWPLADRRSKCYSTVQYGYFKSTNGLQWDNCYPTCQFCSGTGDKTDNKCTICNNRYYPVQDKPSTCSDLAPPAYFFNVLTQTWDHCYITCSTCKELGTSDEHKCTSCVFDYFPLDSTSKCVNSNIPGYYLDSSQKRFLKCDLSCETCQNTSTTCLTCNNGFFFYQQSNLCLSICPKGYFENEKERLCETCSAECSTCQKEKNFCLTCASELFLLENTCIKKCPSRFYEVYSTRTCMPCYERCLTCTNGGKADCLTCLEDFPYLKKGECSPRCLDEELELPNNFQCILVSSCIKYVVIDIPYVFNIEYRDFRTKVNMELTSNCIPFQALIARQLDYQWSELYQGTLSEGNTVLVIAENNLKSGLKTFTIKILFNRIIIYTVTKYSQFKNNRVRIVIVLTPF